MRIFCCFIILITATAGARSADSIWTLAPCELDYATPADAECGRLSVPENPADPKDRRIELNVMRVRGLSQTAPDPLFIIVGGPGAAAVKSAPQYLPYFRQLQQKRDIVFVDQRGTGESNPLSCPFEQIQFAPLTDEQRRKQSQQLAAQCASSLQADLEFYTTPYAVQDLERVRQALGYRQVNLWGASYGTRVVLEYMRQQPEVVRTAVLDGVAPVSIQLPRFAAKDGARALASLFRFCAEQESCATTYGNLQERWLRLLDNLQAEPRDETFIHPRSQRSVPSVVTPATLSSWVQLSLYSRELAPLIPQAIERATGGDFSVFGAIGVLASEELSEHVSQGMQATVLCAEDRYYARHYASAPPDGMDQDTGLLRLDRAEWFDRLCEHFPQGQLDAEYFAPVESAVPSLLLSGELDPVTPPRWAEQVLQGLSNSQHIVVAGAHHGVTMQGCMPRLVSQFIEARDASSLDLACSRAIQPRPFFIDGAGPDLSAALPEAQTP